MHQDSGATILGHARFGLIEAADGKGRERMKGSIQKRSKASWQLRYYGPPDAKGKRRHLSETIQGTKVVAERVLRERLTAIENGGFISKDKETVGDFTQRWLDTYARTNTRSLSEKDVMRHTYHD